MHPAIQIFRAVLIELLKESPNWRTHTLDTVKARFTARVTLYPRRQKSSA